MGKKIFPDGKSLLLRISHGLSDMFTNQGAYLCWDPNERDILARNIWHRHSEERLRYIISERLVTKKVEVE